jgi:hypothetical protein
MWWNFDVLKFPWLPGLRRIHVPVYLINPRPGLEEWGPLTDEARNKQVAEMGRVLWKLEDVVRDAKPGLKVTLKVRRYDRQNRCFGTSIGGRSA